MIKIREQIFITLFLTEPLQEIADEIKEEEADNTEQSDETEQADETEQSKDTEKSDDTGIMLIKAMPHH